ncbi:ABC transporter substrate-binding protein [Vagococcus sp. PNs007]|uniref:ABC transporter substrate-binding protein n=1 Tax=Vagococcus proximus TaxID=2991417 RepID=A0ABT5X050_9ENTE|nr:ABC transporter substrate-binding protein [Vagococcus proximus]MDF0479384.1 ABC transporter substrate-binding protein [Vagococcus proximus]
MKLGFKKLLLSGAVLGLAAVTLAGCGSLTGDSKKASNDKSKDGSDTLLMYRVGDKPTNYDEIMEVVNKRMKEEIGVELNMQFIGWGDYEKKMSVITSSGENYDIAFANNYVNTAQKGAYKDITELAPKYAKETYENLDPTYIEGNKVNGKLYSIPVNANVFAQRVITFDKELVDKYKMDITKVKTLDDLAPLLKTIKENEQNVVPFAAGKDIRMGNFDYVYDVNVPLGIDLDGDEKTIVNPYETSDRMKNELKAMHNLYSQKFIPQDAATSDEIYRLDDKTWFARVETQGPFDYGDTILTRAAGRELVSVPLTDPLKDNGQMFVANWVISNTSKNAEKALEAINLINTDKDILTTMVFGLEGEAWEKVGDDKMKILDGYDASKKVIGGAWMSGDNKTLYTDEAITDDMIKERDEKIAAAKTSPLLGFNFNGDSVKTEVTNITNVTAQYRSGLSTGTLDPEKAIPEFNAKLKEAGLEKVQQEMQKQFDEFNSKKK